MSASIEWIGLKELIASLRELPADLTEEASGIVLGAAETAAADIASAYPVRTGTLGDSVRVDTISGGQFGARARVRNTSKDATWFERGTTTRQTALGANRGAMPPGNVFVPRMVRHRALMYRSLAAMMERHGLEVTGTP